VGRERGGGALGREKGELAEQEEKGKALGARVKTLKINTAST